jgi:hypothetical protein
MSQTVTLIELDANPRFDLKGGKQTGYLIENLLTPDEFDALTKFWEQFHVHGLDWDKTIYYFKGRAHATANQRTFNTHYDRVIFDLTRSPEWYYQTPETIYDWSNKKLASTAHPRILQLFEKVKQLPPFNQCSPDKWIPTRGLINVLIYEQLLTYHFDTDPAIYNVPISDVNQYSITIYLNEVSHGGEFWVDSDPPFLYNPVPNSAFIFNGGRVLHGVNTNLDHEKRTRKAVTFRISHVDSLLLPGSPDKFLYKTHDLSEVIK